MSRSNVDAEWFRERWSVPEGGRVAHLFPNKGWATEHAACRDARDPMLFTTIAPADARRCSVCTRIERLCLRLLFTDETGCWALPCREWSDKPLSVNRTEYLPKNMKQHWYPGCADGLPSGCGRHVLSVEDIDPTNACPVEYQCNVCRRYANAADDILYLYEAMR